MKKIFNKVIVIATVCIFSMFFTACPPDPVPLTVICAIGAGQMRMVNKSTNQTKDVSGAINPIISTPDSENCLEACNGDVIELSYIPDEDYNKYKYTVIFTLIDGEEITCTGKDCAYEFTLSGVEPGIYPIKFSANDNEGDNINITGFGTGYIKVLE